MKNKKVFIGAVVGCVVVLAAFLCVKTQNRGIALGNVVLNENDRPAEWQNIITKEINAYHIKLIVDGKEVQFKQAGIFVDEDMNIMIPAYIFSDTFNCAFNAYDSDIITLQKGNNIVTLNSSCDYIVYNGQNISFSKSYVIRNNVAYINVDVLKEVLGYTYEWNTDDNVLKMVNQRSYESILPNRYNYRDTKRFLNIKNQGNTSICWAFASLSALETSLMPMEHLELSIDNMVGNNGYINTLNDGGDYTRAIAYLTSWRGPVLEEDDPYGDGLYDTLAQPVKHVQEVQIIESKNLEAIKKAVFLYGGVESSLYTSMNDHDNSSIYYNNVKSAYCYNGNKKPNHDIVIIGWDDDYSKDNFSVETNGNGAFICMNSWGTEFGDNGLFYVSYYDTNIGVHNVVYTGVEDTDNYDNIYQSDICGWVGQLGYDSETAYFSNVYTAKEDEEIKAVGFYATDKNTSYDVYVVEDFYDTLSFDSMKYVQSGTFENAGFYTVNLKKDIQLEAGKKYAVVIKIKTPNAIHPIAIEYVAGKSTRNVILDDGEGYISYTGNTWEHVETSKNCNICLKVYTNNK